MDTIHWIHAPWMRRQTAAESACKGIALNDIVDALGNRVEPARKIPGAASRHPIFPEYTRCERKPNEAHDVASRNRVETLLRSILPRSTGLSERACRNEEQSAEEVNSLKLATRISYKREITITSNQNGAECRCHRSISIRSCVMMKLDYIVLVHWLLLDTKKDIRAAIPRGSTY
jgi:hypothetical protein